MFKPKLDICIPCRSNTDHNDVISNSTLMWPCIVTNFLIIKPTIGQFLCPSSRVIHCTLSNAWWWTEESSETCRVLFQNKFEKLVRLVCFITRKFVTMHGHMSVEFELTSLWPVLDLHSIHMSNLGLTLVLLTWRIWWAPNNASKWQMGFNSASKRLYMAHRYYENVTQTADT
jgi:hypothetical protein